MTGTFQRHLGRSRVCSPTEPPPGLQASSLLLGIVEGDGESVGSSRTLTAASSGQPSAVTSVAASLASGVSSLRRG